MEIWFNTDTRQIMLPVLPPEIFINGGSIETSINMLGNGEVSLFGGNKLQDCEFSCFFPAKKNIESYKFLQHTKVEDPYYYVKQFNWWKKYGQVVQFIITPNIESIPMRIISFDYGEKDGSGDVYYTVKLKEVKQITIRKLSDNNNSNSNNTRPPSQTQDKENNNKQKVYKVVKGDNLWDIAQKYYGKGSDYPKIKKANESKYPSLKNNNVIYSGWELIIP